MLKKYPYERKEIFDYDEYIKFMESKKVRHGKDRTYTLLDFVTEEEHARLLKECALDLNKFDPTPPVLDKYPDDEDIKELLKEENTKERCSTNWYEKFGYKLPPYLTKINL